MTEEPIHLNLNDFAAVVQIIDVCTERGAFKGNELVTVGTVRDKFAAFVKANAPVEEITDTTEGAQ